MLGWRWMPGLWGLLACLAGCVCSMSLRNVAALLQCLHDADAEIQSGSLDDPSRVTPETDIYAKDAVAWDRFDLTLPRYQGLPDRRRT